MTARLINAPEEREEEAMFNPVPVVRESTLRANAELVVVPVVAKDVFL